MAPALPTTSCRRAPLATLSHSHEMTMEVMRWLQVAGLRSGQPWLCLTPGGQPLLSRVSRVHGAVTEQGPSLSPALSPTWHVGRA